MTGKNTVRSNDYVKMTADVKIPFNVSGRQQYKVTIRKITDVNGNDITAMSPFTEFSSYISVADPETQTTASTTYIATTTTTTTAPNKVAKVLITNINLTKPNKTEYNVGETVDYTGSFFYYMVEAQLENGAVSSGGQETRYLSNITDTVFRETYSLPIYGTSSTELFDVVLDRSKVDTSKPGTYTVTLDITSRSFPNVHTQSKFDIVVKEPQTTTSTTTTMTTTTTTTSTVSLKVEANLTAPAKTEYNTGETVDYSGAYISYKVSDDTIVWMSVPTRSLIDTLSPVYTNQSSSSTSIGNITVIETLDRSKVDTGKAGVYPVTYTVSVEGRPELTDTKSFNIVVKDPGKTYSPGDVDMDGTVDASDASQILEEFAAVVNGGQSTFTDGQNKLADVNGDKTVDSSDASLVLAYYSYVMNGGTEDITTWLKTV